MALRFTAQEHGQAEHAKGMHRPVRLTAEHLGNGLQPGSVPSAVLNTRQVFFRAFDPGLYEDWTFIELSAAEKEAHLKKAMDAIAPGGFLTLIFDTAFPKNGKVETLHFESSIPDIISREGWAILVKEKRSPIESELIERRKWGPFEFHDLDGMRIVVQKPDSGLACAERE